MKKTKNPFLWGITHWEEVITCAAVASMLVVCCAYVLARYIFSYSIVWGQEFCTICLVYVTFIGSAAAYKRNLHYGMDFLTDHLPDQLRYMIKLLLNFILVFLFAYLTYASFVYTMNSKKTMQISRIPYSYLDLSAVLGFASMTFYSVLFFIQGIFKPEKFKEKFLKTADDYEETGAEE